MPLAVSLRFTVTSEPVASCKVMAAPDQPAPGAWMSDCPGAEATAAPVSSGRLVSSSSPMSVTNSGRDAQPLTSGWMPRFQRMSVPEPALMRARAGAPSV